MPASSTTTSMIDRYWPADGTSARTLRAVVIVLFGTLLLTASAKVQVPFWPVPMTLQTGVVALIGLSVGWRLGLAIVGAYLIEGAIGLPVLAGTPEKGIGLIYMLGATRRLSGGFPGSGCRHRQRLARRNVITAGVATLLGLLPIFGLGTLWLGHLIGMDKALTFGLWPFLPGETVKIAMVVALFATATRKPASTPGPLTIIARPPQRPWPMRLRRCALAGWSPFPPRPSMAWAQSDRRCRGRCDLRRQGPAGAQPAHHPPARSGRRRAAGGIR